MKPAEARPRESKRPSRPMRPWICRFKPRSWPNPFLPPQAQGAKTDSRESKRRPKQRSMCRRRRFPRSFRRIVCLRGPTCLRPPREAPARPKIGAAVEVATGASNLPSGAAMPAAKLPARAFVPPPSAPGRQSPTVAAPQIDGPPGDITIAIAGLNPATTSVKLPAASSPAQFAAGEKVRPQGATSDGAGSGISVPDLYAQRAGFRKKARSAGASVA